MPAMHIARSTEIKASPRTIFDVVTDFTQWRNWSPWLITDPETKVNVAPDGKSYTWTGKRTGEGNMAILGGSTREHIRYSLEFLKPWKSRADVAFLLEKKGDTTGVTWTMDSDLPFFLFWMKNMMEAALGMDYDRGLAMLKDYIEAGRVPSVLEWEGESDFSGFDYVGVNTTCGMTEIGPRMQEDFERLHEAVNSEVIQPAGVPVCQYHKWDLAKGSVNYTCAIPVGRTPADLPEGFVSGSIPSTKVYVIKHTGPYRHLGNAWSTGQIMQRSKEIQLSKSVHPFERYVTDPAEVAEEETVTEVCFPLK